MAVSRLVSAQEYAPVDANRPKVEELRKTDGQCMSKSGALRPLFVNARAQHGSYDQRLDMCSDVTVVDNAHDHLHVDPFRTRREECDAFEDQRSHNFAESLVYESEGLQRSIAVGRGCAYSILGLEVHVEDDLRPIGRLANFRIHVQLTLSTMASGIEVLGLML